MSAPLPFFLYLITDRRVCRRPLTEAVAAALDGGVQTVQLREKDLPARELFRLAEELRRLTEPYHAHLLINDRLDVAEASGADGVHLGRSSLPVASARLLLGPEAMIGFSAHDAAEIAAAARDGADFATFSPIYPTASKVGFGPPQGIPALTEACRHAALPIFALGGITPQRVAEVRGTGAAGVAVIRAILEADDPEGVARRFRALWDAA